MSGGRTARFSSRAALAISSELRTTAPDSRRTSLKTLIPSTASTARPDTTRARYTVIHGMRRD